MLSLFSQYVHSFAGPRSHFIVAASGGLDSSVLCALCNQAGFSFSIAHCNFRLRGEESSRDESFVRSLAEKYGKVIHVRAFDTESIANAEKASVQETARKLRYEWFAALRRQESAAFVLLAHHADDAVETLLMHFFRGTGLAGLTGIPETSPDHSCLRPLLSFSRAELLSFAQENNLQWVEDSSNAGSKYTRNIFRNDLLPAIEKLYPQVRSNLAGNIQRFRMIRNFYDASVAELKKRLIRKQNGMDTIPVLKLMQYQDSSFLYEVLKDYGFGEKQLPDLVRLSQSESGRFIESDAYRIVRNRRWFLMIPKRADTAETVLIEDEVPPVSFSQGALSFRKLAAAGYQVKKTAAIAQLDLQHVVFPLLLRKWKQGDYFYPFGLGKKKKLSRFFIDLKLSLAEKENIWVLQSGDKIIWVVGLRIDHRFRITEKTRELLVITLSPI